MSEELATPEELSRREERKVRRAGRKNTRGNNPIYENVCESDKGWAWKSRTVRVWFSRTLEGPDSEEDSKVLNDYVSEHSQDEVGSLDYAILLASELPRVNAVEVRDGDHGSLYYPEWP